MLDDAVCGPHSETHNPLKYERWARFIAYPVLPDDLLEKITTELQALRQEAAAILKQDTARVRTNLFAPMNGALRMIPGATVNMKYAPEFDLKIIENHGSTGTAFATASPCMVIKRGATWTGNTLPGDELEKINPALKWVISLPLRSSARSIIVGVVNVDGLDNLPEILQDPDSRDCKATLLALHLGSLRRFEPCLEAGFRGDPPTQIEA